MLVLLYRVSYILAIYPSAFKVHGLEMESIFNSLYCRHVKYNLNY